MGITRLGSLRLPPPTGAQSPGNPRTGPYGRRFAGLGADDLRLWRVDWYQSADVRRAVRERRQVQLTIADDGSFSASEVTRGDYQLTLDARAEESGQRHLLEGRATEWSGRIHRRIQVPNPAPGVDEAPVDLGEIDVAIWMNRPK